MNQIYILNISRTLLVFFSIIIDSVTIFPCNTIKNSGFITIFVDDYLSFLYHKTDVNKSNNY